MYLLKGLCKNCNGCNRQEVEAFEGVYRCEYATSNITVEQIRKENRDGRKIYKRI